MSDNWRARQAALNQRGGLNGSTPLTMAKYTMKGPSVPGSCKAEGAKNFRFPNTYICTYNVRSLKDQNRLEELENELSETRYKSNIIGLSETRRKGEHLVQLNTRYVLYTKGTWYRNNSFLNLVEEGKAAAATTKTQTIYLWIYRSLNIASQEKYKGCPRNTDLLIDF